MSPRAADTPIYYAEYLPNIKTITLTVTSAPGSSLGLDPRGLSIRVTDPSGKTAVIPLPAKHDGNSSSMRISQDPRNPGQTVIRLSAQEPANCSRANDDEPIIPWTANQLNKVAEVRCKSCNGIVVSNGNLNSWKDLPSEGWAEMMDLWHCHKPDEHQLPGHEHEHTSGKGYAAGSKLVSKKGTGFVDAMSFLLQEEDCIGVDLQPTSLSTQIEDSTSEARSYPCCKACKSPLGVVDEQSEGLKLHKPFLALSFSGPTSSSTPFTKGVEAATTPPAVASPIPTSTPSSEKSTTVTSQSFPLERWLSCHLLSLISSTGVRKFLSKNSDWEIWVFSTTLLYTSSHPSSPESTTSTPTEAMKVFFRRFDQGNSNNGNRKGDRKDGSQSLNKENLLIDELRLPERLEEDLWRVLVNSQERLPEGAGNFAGWEVGLLEKFGDEDLKSGC